jgi:AraC-like DNA-binding protein
MTAEFFSYHQTGVDQAMAAVGENYFTTAMHLIDRRVPYRFRFDGINLGALSVGKAWYNVGIDIAMTDLETSYYVNFPQIGGLLAEHRGRSLNIAPGCAAVYQPIGGVHMRTSGDITFYAVRIDRAALENQLAARLGRRIHRPLALSLSLNLAHPAGANWARLVRLLATEAAAYRITGRTALTNPLIAAPLHDAVLDGLLQASDHPDRDALEEPVHAWGTAPVHRAIDAMHAHPDHPFTPADLAQIASCSLRSLQEGFRRYVGLTPMQYLRQIRLEHAHHDLAHADPTHHSVTDIAYHWGFHHPGRFATTYRTTYGQSPSHTLQRPVPRRRAKDQHCSEVARSYDP